MTKGVWSRMFRDLLSEVLEWLVHLLSAGETKQRSISALSQVSKDWSSSLRPLLFRTLHLDCVGDVETLLSILGTPMSRWLRGCIHGLTLEDNPRGAKNPGQPRSLPYLLDKLFPLIPALSNLEYRCHTATSRFMPRGITYRTLGKMSALRELVLKDFHFLSFRHLHQETSASLLSDT